MSKHTKIHIEQTEFERYIDNATLWQRRALLLKFELDKLGYGNLTNDILAMNKQQCTEKLTQYIEGNNTK